jgi:hypothetical protein
VSAFADPVKCKNFSGAITVDGIKFSTGASSGLQDNCKNPYQCMPSLPEGTAEVHLNALLSPVPNLPIRSVAGSFRCTSVDAYSENLIELHSVGPVANQIFISFSTAEDCMLGLDKLNEGQKIKIGFEAQLSQFGWVFTNAQVCE